MPDVFLQHNLVPLLVPMCALLRRRSRWLGSETVWAALSHKSQAGQQLGQLGIPQKSLNVSNILLARSLGYQRSTGLAGPDQGSEKHGHLCIRVSGAPPQQTNLQPNRAMCNKPRLLFPCPQCSRVVQSKSATMLETMGLRRASKKRVGFHIFLHGTPQIVSRMDAMQTTGRLPKLPPLQQKTQPTITGSCMLGDK